ncbi:cell division ATP-binding protein FtsE [bacterium]|nr:cell division ATP-binding protein FtsE [bacterium]
MIYFENVSKSYFDDTSPALENINFSVEPGELLSIVGHSGAGKTTLLKMILAEEFPTEGKVFFESSDIQTLNKQELLDLRRRIGMIFQDFRLLPHKTAYENIRFAMEAAGRSEEEIEADAPHVLELVGLEEKLWNFPSELSGGEKQRVAIARAIVNQPDIVIADEPTGNLDPINAYDIIEILKKVNEMGKTVILTTHNKGVIDALGKRVITIDKGKIIRDDAKGKYIL